MKADVFFFVTTIMIVFVSILFGIALFYLIKIFKRTNTLYDKIEENINKIDINIKEIILSIKESFLFNLLFRRKKNKK